MQWAQKGDKECYNFSYFTVRKNELRRNLLLKINKSLC